MRIEIIAPGEFSDAELVPGYEYLEERVRQKAASTKIGRNPAWVTGCYADDLARRFLYSRCRRYASRYLASSV
jgi:hypothetical protein